MTETLPYGTWPSPLSAADLAASQVYLDDLVVDGEGLRWIELRPSEGGRQALVAWDVADGTRDLAPDTMNVRTRVHEYGGAPFAARDGVVIASDYSDQRMYRILDGVATPLTEEPSMPAGIRYADGDISPDGRWLVCVRETHHAGGEPVNDVVAIDLTDGTARQLYGGRDFVAAPRLSPDGSRLCWLAWDHPNMPWDAAELHVGDFDDGVLTHPAHVGGGPGNAATSPVWASDGTLYASLDGSGFWEIYRLEGQELQAVTDLGADAGFPGWVFGSHAVAPLEDGRLAAIVTEQAVGRLVLVDPSTRATETVPLPYVRLETVRPWRGGVAFIAAEPGGARVVATWVPEDGLHEVQRVDLKALRDGDRGTAEALEVPTPDGAVTRAFLHRPANADVVGPPDERPPLVVFTHGGPNGGVAPVLTPSIAYWTTRGFAVADVNYRGSVGYGRSYRDALQGSWGVHDVTDTIAVARHLEERGDVDGNRMAIRGGSAGGYTTLAVLTCPDHPFACGTSFFGVADLELLTRHTHKFESRYLDGLVGALPEAADIYRERSPLTHVGRLQVPILVLQGLEDEVVPPDQAEAIVAAAAARGLPHAYLAFEGEQHGFRRAENIVTWLESELAFYGQVMGFTPAGDLAQLDLRG